MNYGDINNKWKQFLAENTFKEDVIVKPEKKKKKNKKEIIVSEDEVNEWEEFEHQDESVINDQSGSGTNNATDSVEEESLEEMSAVSAGAITGYAGNAFAPKKKVKPY